MGNCYQVTDGNCWTSNNGDVVWRMNKEGSMTESSVVTMPEGWDISVLVANLRWNIFQIGSRVVMGYSFLLISSLYAEVNSQLSASVEQGWMFGEICSANDDDILETFYTFTLIDSHRTLLQSNVGERFWGTESLSVIFQNCSVWLYVRLAPVSRVQGTISSTSGPYSSLALGKDCMCPFWIHVLMLLRTWPSHLVTYFEW